MPKLPDCNRCLLYAHDPHLVCAVHPDGVEGNTCPDFELDPPRHRTLAAGRG